MNQLDKKTLRYEGFHLLRQRALDKQPHAVVQLWRIKFADEPKLSAIFTDYFKEFEIQEGYLPTNTPWWKFWASEGRQYRTLAHFDEWPGVGILCTIYCYPGQNPIHVVAVTRLVAELAELSGVSIHVSHEEQCCE